jgi:excisionase family DNA binding protein
MPQYEWVSVTEASRRLDVSPSTVRRMIEEGKLVGEREVIGGSKTAYKVRLETLQDASETLHEPPASSESGDAPTTPHDAPTAAHDASGLTQRALDIVDTVIRSNAETMDRQAAQLDRYSELLRQETGRRVKAEAERDALAARLAEERAAREAAERRVQERRFRWWPW